MTRILIAVDMEGITGVTTFEHVTPTHPEYARFRRLMTGDVNAAVRGAAAGGADEIWVVDGHWDGNNILIEELDGRAQLISGSPAPLSMVQGVENGVTGVLFVGYHAHMGTANAILDHTMSSMRVANLWINGRLTGEIGMNAMVCGFYGAPVLLVTGDQSACAEAGEWINGVDSVVVKDAAGRSNARCLTPEASHLLIEQAAKRAVQRAKDNAAPQPVAAPSPVTVTLEFLYSSMADHAAMMPTVQRLDARKIEFQAADMPSAYRAFRCAVKLAEK